jgi:hypothetical protein
LIIASLLKFRMVSFIYMLMLLGTPHPPLMSKWLSPFSCSPAQSLCYLLSFTVLPLSLSLSLSLSLWACSIKGAFFNIYIFEMMTSWLVTCLFYLIGCSAASLIGCYWLVCWLKSGLHTYLSLLLPLSLSMSHDVPFRQSNLMYLNPCPISWSVIALVM